jgi:hypothetical protein
MASENELKQYIKLLIKEYESAVLADDRYRNGPLDAGFIHQQYNVAVGKYLKNVSEREAAGIADNDRLYYRGWISSYQTMMLNLEHQARFELQVEAWAKERAQLDKERERQAEAWAKERAKLDKEMARLHGKIAKLEEKLTAKTEKAKKK